MSTLRLPSLRTVATAPVTLPRTTPLLAGPAAAVRRVVARPLGLPSPLRGRVVVVTGASSGIGEATARAVAGVGAHVVLVARRAEELERVAGEIAAAGGSVTWHAVDLTDAAAIDALVATLLEEHGAVDHLVNNAGRSIRRSLALSTDRMHDFERTMAINYLGPVRLTLGLLPAMRAQRFGHVVNIVSWGVQIKAPKFSAYLASKAALDTFARIAGRETFADNVAFTNIRVSLVQTPMTAPTEAYRGRGSTPEAAAARILRALEDRPITQDVLAGRLGEAFNLLAPRLSDALFAGFDALFPDSAAARAGLAAVPDDAQAGSATDAASLKPAPDGSRSVASRP
ncbi:SDR family NAD(P)-dependent oxidoreductase [Nocardioides sp. TRM66260-LWL]|uniref:SDR family NAD(P)-dependent oxidoreductase n=1 Tax=Nocardioides sp. TRM66260-LWL TaxID=2874478 RepID=UPI001CC77C66|nr:SDR family NAD(P)-dependent oxidoreductase [Nocardioides sp. TRM66260-LWL]MBZ5732882.1 SDR family NAD(P)-dependent oxidoreductase [Nocardioides sp. TRM66260-LWL]